MKIQATQIRPGQVLEVDGKLWRVLKATHVTPGKGVACMQVEMRSITEGTKKNVRFNSTERVERVVLTQRPMQFLYDDGEMFYFMDQETYEQVALPRDFVEHALAYLLPNTEVIVEFHGEQPLNVQLPPTVELTVAECESVVKGQTATGSYKPAKLETGATIKVPPYIKPGDKIRVNTETGEFVERV